MDRDSTAKLASQLESSAVDWFIAGGRQHFKNNGLKIYEELPRQKIDFPAGVLAAEGLLPYISDGRGDYLIRSLAYTLRVFEDQPFFLLVENGHIDGAGHANEAGKLVDEVLDFDRAIGAAMDYVDAHPETLLIVTADHETGGVSIPHGDAERVELAFQGDDHTGIKVPLFAYGAGAGQFSGFLDNTAVFDLILAYFGIRADSN